MQREEAERELEALLVPDAQEDVEVVAVEPETEAAPEAKVAEEPEAIQEPELPIAPEYFFENAPEPEPGDPGYAYQASPEPEPKLEPEPEPEPEPKPEPEPDPEVEPEPERIYQLDPDPEPERIYQLDPDSEPERIYQLDPDSEPEGIYELDTEPEPEGIYELVTEPEPERIYELEAEPGIFPAPEEEDGADVAEPEALQPHDAEDDVETGRVGLAWSGPAVVVEPEPETAPDHAGEAAEVETELDGRPSRAPVERVSRASRRAGVVQHRSEWRKKRSLVTAAVLIVAAVLGGWLLLSGGNEDERTRSVAGSGDPLSVRNAGPVTTLLFGTQRADSGGSVAVWLTLLTADPGEDRGSVVYIPAHTAVDVPGRGLQGVGESYSSGGVQLLLLSVENLLGIDIDRYAELPYEDGQALFGAAGELTVNVPSEVRVAAGRDRARLIFVEGPQDMSPEGLARFLYVQGIDGDDIEVGGRHLAFWDALLDRFESDPTALGEAVAKSGAALTKSDAEAEEHAALFEALAGLGSGELTLAQLPVRPISAGDSELYAAEAAELANFIKDTIGIRASTRDEVRVQILNGNGVPGIGARVARDLVGHGYRVLLTGNARELTHRKTLIVTYDSTNAGRAAAQRARELLGVGQVQVSAQQQGIVDLTIVVGKDFLRT
jgi:anionic cell wall polymer biosynthesis LytR-Cps2A-Psr (LCP) family protein